MKTINKILVVGAFSSNPDIYSYADTFCKTFQSLGYKIKKIEYRRYRFCNLRLLLNAFLYKPDLIFFVKAENISYKVIRLLKKLNVSLVNFYPDNPFSFWNRNSNSNILMSLPLYDCFLIWSKMLIPVIKSSGSECVYYFPFAYDKELFMDRSHLGVGLFEEHNTEKLTIDVCFIGTWEPEREKWLAQLCEKLPNLNLAIWGNLWEESLPEGSVLKSRLRGKAICGKKMIKAFQESKIVLNFIRKQNATSHNMRTFEVPASGAFLLTQRTKEQAELLFKEGESVECFDTLEELTDKIKFYLVNENLREDIKKKAIERVKLFTMQKVLNDFMQFFEKRERSGKA